jgi:anti-sigma regulatory factor (Ser/Thr protein kinase)
MAIGEPFVVDVTDPSGAAEARRQAATLAVTLGFDETDVGRVAIVVTEAATNLIKHAGGGVIVGHPVVRGGHCSLEILALDRGPGIGSIDSALRDGYSSAGSPGTGLGAIRRASTEFDIYSTRTGGTAIFAALEARAHGDGRGGSTLRLSGLSVPMPGQEVCGDAWTYRLVRDGVAILVVDGLGHGPGAAEAAREARRIFEEGPDGASASQMLERLHRGLRSTRGAAGAIAHVEPQRELLTYAGVGNIAGRILESARTRALVSHNGILGHEVRRIQEFTYPWPGGSTLVLHSDGLISHWSLDGYPGVIRCHPGLIAGVLYRDFRRAHDDVTVVVASLPPS